MEQNAWRTLKWDLESSLWFPRVELRVSLRRACWRSVLDLDRLARGWRILAAAHG
jgi:hypothetical protein